MRITFVLKLASWWPPDLVRIETLFVGKELLIGRTLNTNAHWVGRRLALAGTMIARMTTIDDDLDEISSSLREILRRHPDFLVVVGGLGPTPDDMTLAGIARGLGTGMKLNREALRLIREHYAELARRDFKITPSRRKMAVLPSGASPVLNEKGTAPGVRIVEGTTVIFCLPGVPVEMKSIFRRSVEPEIKNRVGRLYRRAARLRLEGMYESSLAPFIKRELEKHPGAYIKSHPKGIRDGVSRIELDVVAVTKAREDATRAVQEIVEEFASNVRKAGAIIRSVRGVRIDAEG
jgi:molybdenum cofactor synthesis domain-containing protein